MSIVFNLAQLSVIFISFIDAGFLVAYFLKSLSLKILFIVLTMSKKPIFLAKKIGFLDIVKTINKIFKDKDFKKYAKRNPASLKEIKMTDNWARLKTLAMCVR